MKTVAAPLACWLSVLVFLPTLTAEEATDAPVAAVPDTPASLGPSFTPIHVQIGRDGIEQHILTEGTKPVAAPATAPPSENLLGTWCDLRPALEHDGITPSVQYVADLAGNPVGGQRQGFTDADELSVSLDCNLERLCGLTGAKAVISMISRSGSSLTDDCINNVFQVQQEFGGSTWHLYNVLFEQSLANDRFNIRVGRQAAGDDFLVSPYAPLFMQNTVNGNPVGILFNAPGMTTPPVATWGARFVVKPVEEVLVRTGFYDGNPNLAMNDMYGLDFSLHGPLFWISELEYAPNTRKGATGLPGHYKVGIWYNDGSFDVFTPFAGLPPRLHEFIFEEARKLRLDNFFKKDELNVRTRWGDYGYYAMMDQVLWQHGQQRVSVFGSYLVAPDQQINQMPYFADAGIVWRAPLLSRPKDVAGFQVSGGVLSTALRRTQRIEQLFDPETPVQTYEMVLEAMYSIHVAQGLLVQPDVQYIINPGAAGQYPDALVLGVQLTLTF
jgi:porin